MIVIATEPTVSGVSRGVPGGVASMVCDEVLEIVRPFGLRSSHSCKKSAKLASLAAGQPEATSQASQPGSQSKPSSQIQQAAASNGQQSHGGMAANLPVAGALALDHQTYFFCYRSVTEGRNREES